MELIRLTRVFKMGSVVLQDLAPDLAPDESLKLYANAYPHLASATLSPPVSEGEQLVYEVQKPPVKVKG